MVTFTVSVNFEVGYSCLIWYQTVSLLFKSQFRTYVAFVIFVYCLQPLQENAKLRTSYDTGSIYNLFFCREVNLHVNGFH